MFGYVVEGEIIFELEGQPERVITAGEAFWEPGGDVIHYQDGNNLVDAWSRFVVVMMYVSGEPMLTLVDADELERRRDRRGRGPARSPRTIATTSAPPTGRATALLDGGSRLR